MREKFLLSLYYKQRRIRHLTDRQRTHTSYRQSRGTAFIATARSLSYPSAPNKLCSQCMLPSRLKWQEGKLRCITCGYAPRRPTILYQRGVAQENGLELSLRTVRSV